MNNKKISDSYNEFLEKVIIGIREVSEITGVPIRKLRYWEDKGIITAVDSDASVRKFSLSDVKKIILINELIEDGYTLDGAAAKVEKRLSKINGIMEMINISNYN
ncbi:MerR family transcriptional regulator [Salmonella enterica subsp. enterica serovar Poona]|nr:MerR family transcriptional regulator [Salmonella enterica subsp. enterica serovar Poona]